jgi:hypothetical protein
MPYASIPAPKNKKMNQCIQEAVFQQKVSVFWCLFLDAGKSDSDTQHLQHGARNHYFRPGQWAAGSLRWDAYKL